MWCGFCCVFWPHDSALKIKKSAIIPKILLDAVSYLKNFQSLLIISENDKIKVTFGNVIGKFVYGWNLTRYFFNFNFHERNTWSRVQRINRPYFWHSSGPKLGPFLGLEFHIDSRFGFQTKKILIISLRPLLHIISLLARPAVDPTWCSSCPNVNTFCP